MELDPSEYSDADRQEVNPPIQAQVATWTHGGQLDWWVLERSEWLGRVRGTDGKKRWIRASDLRPANGQR
jgi:hypothetical protein